MCACLSMILMKNLYTVFGLIFVFQSIQREYRNHQTLQFLPLCLVLSRFSSSRVSLESKLCVCFQSFVFFPPASLFSLSPDVCERADVRLCVCVCKRTCAGFVFLLNIPLMLLFIYLFPCLRRPFLGG